MSGFYHTTSSFTFWTNKILSANRVTLPIEKLEKNDIKNGDELRITVEKIQEEVKKK